MAIPSSAPDAPAHPQERQPSSLIELLSDWYWEQDTEFRFTVISSRRPDNSADPFPYVGRKHWEQPALNLTDVDWERHRAQLAWHQPFRDFEVQHVTDDGRVVWVSLAGEPRFDESGTFQGYRGIGRDITVTVMALEGNRVRIGVNAPRDVAVDREEIAEKKRQELAGILLSISAAGSYSGLIFRASSRCFRARTFFPLRRYARARFV